ncbi:hypothetical protein DL96DRAFT_1782520 [Flagelloscypha sp. PMI_526]|nr:hypothetical protein DL96DRAFT_1782520 [Flagelloscypha sp. PMI_526]
MVPPIPPPRIHNLEDSSDAIPSLRVKTVDNLAVDISFKFPWQPFLYSFKASTHLNMALAQLRPLDYTKRHGHIHGNVWEIINDYGGETFIVAERLPVPSSTTKRRLHSLSAISSAQLPKNTIFCNPKRNTNDTSATVHDADGTKTCIRCPPSAKKAVSGNARSTVGIVAGSGRTDKSLLKDGRAYYKFKAKRSSQFPIRWLFVHTHLFLQPIHTRGVTLTPCRPSHCGGNHQHIEKASTIARSAAPSQKAGLITARRTDLLRGTVKIKKV